MEETTPTKPPRGVKQKQETSRLLMTTIQSLSNCKSEEQREKEKQKLERDYEKSNKKLDELVDRHYGELTRIMHAFGNVSSQITLARERMTSVKQNLDECKVLLRCRREELRKLWLESVEHSHALHLLDSIGQLRDIPGQVGQLLARKQFTDATNVLISGFRLSQGELSQVEALREVRSELNAKLQALFTKLMEELRYYTYVIPTADASEFRRQGSGKGVMSPFQRGIGNLRGSKGARPKKKLLEVPRGGGGDTKDVEYCDDELDSVDLQERTEIWFNTITECLCLLKKMHDAIDMIKIQMQPEVEAMIPRATKEVLDNSETVAVGSKCVDEGEGGRLLVQVVGVVVERMRRVAGTHALFLRVASRTCTRHNVALRLYDMPEVWTKVQAVLEQWLTEYMETSPGDTDTVHTSHPAMDISSYFARRKPARPRKDHLFRFQRVLGTFSFAKDQREGGRTAQTLVCAAHMKNITLVYGLLRELVEELEGAVPPPCSLRVYLRNYVKDVFLQTQHAALVARIAEAIKDKDAWRSVTGSEQTKELALSTPLLQSTLVVERIVAELRSLINTLPDFADDVLIILTHLLSNYREVSLAAYRGIVQPDSEDKRIFSSAWTKDDDINRFLKSLPNWLELQAHKPTHRNRRIKWEETTEEESPEDVRQRNVKEAEMLASNIGEGGVHRTELISDVVQLRKLAHLHESMEWLSAQILLVNGDLKSVREASRVCPILVQSEQKLFQLVHEFTDLADICLMVLHLEVRVQCFHYLPSKLNSSEKNSSLEPDVQVTQLSKLLIAIHQAMVECMQPRKIKYIFEGLGHLVSKILISTAQYMERINEHGVDRMGRNIVMLQQTLSHMTATRDLALDHARAYFQLFHLTPQEVLASIVERGPTFTDMEYINALQLLHRSHPNAFGPVKVHLERLSDILGETGVTV